MPTAYAQLPVPADVKFVAGDDVEILCTLKEAGTVINLTNYTTEASIVLDDGTTVDFVITNTDLVHGQITLSLTDTVTGGIDIGEYTWSLKITDTTLNYTRTWAKGACIVS